MRGKIRVLEFIDDTGHRSATRLMLGLGTRGGLPCRPGGCGLAGCGDSSIRRTLSRSVGLRRSGPAVPPRPRRVVLPLPLTVIIEPLLWKRSHSRISGGGWGSRRQVSRAPGSPGDIRPADRRSPRRSRTTTPGRVGHPRRKPVAPPAVRAGRPTGHSAGPYADPVPPKEISGMNVWRRLSGRKRTIALTGASVLVAVGLVTCPGQAGRDRQRLQLHRRRAPRLDRLGQQLPARPPTSSSRRPPPPAAPCTTCRASSPTRRTTRRSRSRTSRSLAR